VRGPRVGSDRVALVAIFAVGLILRLAMVAAEGDYTPVYDSLDYDRHARSIAAGDGYPESNIAEGPSAFRPPVYPYLLGAVYAVAGDDAGIDAGRVVGALLGALAILGVYAVGALGWNRRVGLIAAALVAVFPPLVFSGLALISEPLFVLLELGVVISALLARRAGGDWRWAAAAGALCGLAALTRSNGTLLAIPAVIGVWAARPWLSRRALAAPLAVVAAALLVLVPWTVRNATELGAFVPTNTQTGFGLAGAFNDEARDVRGYTATWVLPLETERYGDLFLTPGLSEPELDQELRSMALEYASENPGFVIQGAFLNFARTFHALGEEPVYALADRAQLGLGERTAAVAKWSARVLDVLALAALVLLVVGARDRLRPWFVWLAPILMGLAAVWILGATRYAIPVYPFMCLLVALAADELIAARARRGSGPAPEAAAPRAAATP
jgi:4-amino-4-deoxy-L-arabinose transferase-like glycosyltransferase